MPDVSVIVANYNNEKYLERCINSILNQTERDLELIICDDCSTDYSVRVIEELIKNDERAVLIKNSLTMGASGARMNCIKIAKGKYIAVQDSDDYSTPDRIKIQKEFLDKNPRYAFVSASAYCFDENGVWEKRVCRKAAPENRDFLKRGPYLHAATMFRKEAVFQAGGYVLPTRTQDLDLFFRLHKAGFRGYNLREPLYYYLQDKEAFRRKTYRCRINECRVRIRGYRLLGLMPAGCLIALKPLLVGLIPPLAMKKIKEAKAMLLGR